jgi:hypothetical protein
MSATSIMLADEIVMEQSRVEYGGHDCAVTSL